MVVDYRVVENVPQEAQVKGDVALRIMIQFVGLRLPVVQPFGLSFLVVGTDGGATEEQQGTAKHHQAGDRLMH